MVNIIGYRKIWLSIAGAVIATSIIFIAVFGLRFGIDFTGGSLLEIRFENERPGVPELATLLSETGVDNANIQPAGDDRMILRFKEIDEPKHQEIIGFLNEKFDGLEERRFESIGPTIGKELRTKALYSIVIVLLAIILYIAWAFRKVSKPVASWKYGIIAIIALLHDVIIPIGVFALLGKLLSIEINTAFVAAILTILGYSVNDTIVVFDRVRENLIKAGGEYKDFDKIINKSINQTFTRSINTTITTLLALVAVFMWGGETIKYFALALIVGIGLGAYSSIFIASPLLVVFEKLKRKK